jgi:phosphoadenosine phosphosulfate reductase
MPGLGEAATATTVESRADHGAGRAGLGIARVAQVGAVLLSVAAALAVWELVSRTGLIAERDLPYHPLHDRGYESIGCAPCTHPGSGREGRWAGTDKTECGLHIEEVA